ncbi:hypothetical protein F0562_020284 [Nyssa sinensis]|uniref:MLO-like protein n=1 Tax=Nyssa sinensis TaxID=561372 RepID=A0A5J5BTW1_9ASTE|nr:hypothetical protein F0562_020284 [Nyssa sinensis]
MDQMIREGRSLAETPTWSVASVTTVMVFVGLLVERSIYRFGKWLKKTRRKALSASLEKIKEELMLLGLISLLLGQWASWISQICVNSSLFSSRFYLCSEKDYDIKGNISFRKALSFSNETEIPPSGIYNPSTHQCGEGREPFVSYEGLEQLHRFLFVLGITHVLYSCVAVGLAMSKIYSWRKWENQASLEPDGNLQARKNKVMRRQSTFVLHHASHPWSRSRILIWMLCFLRQFKSSIQKSDYLALRLGFITNHKLPLSYNFHRYMLRSMEDEFYWNCGDQLATLGLCHTVHRHKYSRSEYLLLAFFYPCHSCHGPSIGTQVKPRDDLFWFGKPEILLWLIQFISFQNAFEMATFIWYLWGFKQPSCFMKNHIMIIIRLASGVLVHFWCSYSTVPLNVIITQMGSRCKKALIAESVRDSLHSWCKRVKEKSRRNAMLSVTTRSTCSLESIIDESDEIITVASGTLSRCSSAHSLDQVEINVASIEQPETLLETSNLSQHEYSLRIPESSLKSLSNGEEDNVEDGAENNVSNGEEGKAETLFELFQKT